MSKVIRIGDVAIPLEQFATTGTALLGTKGSGKTYTGKSIGEQLLDLKLPPIICDPIGKWRWLRVAAEGKHGRAFKVVVAGGAEPDLPLTPQSAEAIVRAAIRENIPLVLDFFDKRLSKADWRRIVQTTCRTLLYENEGLRVLFLEETPEFAPQKILDGETYAEVEKLVRMGGNSSVGVVLIGQRAQEVNKAVLDLCETVILMRQRGSNAIDNLEKWIDRLAPDVARRIAVGMPRMATGDAWVFTADMDEPVLTRSGPLHSFHPDRKHPQANPKTQQTADPGEFVQRLSGELAKIIEEAKANEPATLKARIRELEKQLAAKPGKALAGASREELKAAESRGYERGFEEAGRGATREAVTRLRNLKGALHQAIDQTLDAKIAATPMPSTRSETPKAAQIIPRNIPVPVKHSGQFAEKRNLASSDLPPARQKILDKLLWLEQHEVYPPSKETLAAMAGVSPTSGGYFNNLGALRSAGLIEYPQPGTVGFTDAGRAEAHDVPDDRPVHEHWLDVVENRQRQILEKLIEVHPEHVHKDELARAIGVSETSGGYFNNLGRLRTLGAIDYPQPGYVCLTKAVMP